MTNIIKFPGKDATAAPATSPQRGRVNNAKGRVLLAAVVRAIWICVVLLWPVLKWVLSVAVFFQLLLAFYHWDDPGTYAGWTFLGYFAALTAITYFVTIFKPKGL